MARLTREEKFKIQEGISEGLTAKEIAEKISRTETAVTKYSKEFQEVVNSIAKVDNEDPMAELKAELETIKQQLKEAQAASAKVEKPTKVELLEETIIGTVHKLKLNGIKEQEARFALNKVSENLKERIDDASTLAALCMQQLSAYNAMVTRTQGDNEGVAIMTKPASQIMDEQKKNYQGVKAGRDCLYNPKTGEIT